jgi:hypothetical protein
MSISLMHDAKISRFRREGFLLSAVRVDIRSGASVSSCIGIEGGCVAPPTGQLPVVLVVGPVLSTTSSSAGVSKLDSVRETKFQYT